MLFEILANVCIGVGAVMVLCSIIALVACTLDQPKNPTKRLGPKP